MPSTAYNVCLINYLKQRRQDIIRINLSGSWFYHLLAPRELGWSGIGSDARILGEVAHCHAFWIWAKRAGRRCNQRQLVLGHHQHHHCCWYCAFPFFDSAVDFDSGWLGNSWLARITLLQSRQAFTVLLIGDHKCSSSANAALFLILGHLVLMPSVPSSTCWCSSHIKENEVHTERREEGAEREKRRRWKRELERKRKSMRETTVCEIEGKGRHRAIKSKKKRG